MKICICGWYFYKPLLETVKASCFDAYVIKNREGDTLGIPSELSDQMSETGGRGLEFGAYQQYLMKHWDGYSSVLFMQDDGNITVEALEQINALRDRQQINQAFIFRDEYEEYMNAAQSGRAIWMRGSLLATFKKDGGFNVDWDNCGNTQGRQANYSITHFSHRMSLLPECRWIAIVPGIQMGRRGWIPNEPYQYKRVPGETGMVTPQSVL